MSGTLPKLAMELESPRLRFGQGLQFKLSVAFILVTALLAFVAWQVGKTLVQTSVVEDTQRYQRESGLRLSQLVDHHLAQAGVLAATVAELAGSDSSARWRNKVVPLVSASGLDTMVTGIGWWPEPRSAGEKRQSLYWLADGVGELQVRDDYNDPKAVPYWEESWYTPARYATAGRCYWSLLRSESLSRRRVVICALPIRNSSGFKGAVTVSLDARELEKSLRRASSGQSGYALLVDRNNQLIAVAGKAVEPISETRPRNVAELAQKIPAFNTLALDLHRRDEAFLSKSVQSPFYDAETISNLKDRTRNASRQQTESDLALIWNSAASGADSAANPEELLIRSDAILGEDGAATIFELAAPYWKLVRVTSAREGVAGAEYFFTQSLLVLIGTVAITMLLIFAALRFFVLRPLAKMSNTLARVHTVDEAQRVQLNASPKNEIGMISHAYNDRIRQLREASDRAMAQQSQLVVEAGERARADEQALRLKQRSGAVLASIDDAAITVDPNGTIEGMNAPAERLTGVALRDARGRPCGEILKLRLANQPEAAPDFAASVIASSSRVEYSDGIFLKAEGREECEIRFIGTPLHGPGRRSLGAVLVFDEHARQSDATRVVIDRRSNDPITGLPTRTACDRRIREVFTSFSGKTAQHGLLIADVDRLRNVNDTLGMQAGDEVLVRVAEALVQGAPDIDIFRLGADTFALILPSTTETEALELARSLGQAIAASPLQWADRKISTTASFGLVMVDSQCGLPPLELLGRGAKACTVAKEAGRNTVHVYDEGADSTEHLAVDEAKWVRRIRAGLDDGLLHLTTQQLHSVKAKQENGLVFKVSVALEDEEGFWAEPETFLPVAKRTGHAAEVERWALKSTLDHLSRNREVLSRVGLCCIPLSPHTIGDSATLEVLANALQENPQLESFKICFVLGEETLRDMPTPARIFCEAARSLKCRVALFQGSVLGAGAAEIERNLPADFCCIDSRHYKNLANDAVDRIMADSAISVAHSLQRKIIVCEISDESARDAWSQMGVDYLEGPMIARPSPVVFTIPS